MNKEELIGQLVPDIFAACAQRTNRLTIAISAVTSVLVSMIVMNADIADVRVSHLMLDAIIARLQALRAATTAEDMTQLLETLSDGYVSEDGSITKKEEH